MNSHLFHDFLKDFFFNCPAYDSTTLLLESPSYCNIDITLELLFGDIYLTLAENVNIVENVLEYI